VFTGLIADLGSVRACEPYGTGTGPRNGGGDGVQLRIATRLAGRLAPGDSIAVNGVCLTATEVDIDGGEFATQAMAETLRRSTLGSAARVGAQVNLELPLRADGLLGGHIVQGHVDGTGTVKGVHEEGFSRVLTIAPDLPELVRYMVPKGSIAVNGVSLTVSALCDNGFQVSLIPETLQRTNLGGVRAGDRVNVEVDVLAKHVERLLEART
jgi:riboflavin synthase